MSLRSENLETVFNRPDREIIIVFWKWVTIVLSIFLVTYLTANSLASQNPHRYEMYSTWELNVPLVPWMIVVYLSYVGVFLLLPMLMKTGRSIQSLAYAFLTSIGVSTVIFVLFPGELGYHRPEHVAGFNYLFQALYDVDKPHNLFPSLHVTFSSMTALAIAHQSDVRWFRWVIAGWALLIALSVVLVHQHHVFDIVTGLMLGFCCFRFVYLRYV
ncbi:MAG: phosphatase PAP2 family protein [Flavobacteriales bacterium]|nr:phosphatase PAP2 family protein [Flavobacteriales bacterium]